MVYGIFIINNKTMAIKITKMPYLSVVSGITKRLYSKLFGKGYVFFNS